jgi:LysM domain.
MKIGTGILLVVFLIALAPLHLSNAYLRADRFDTVVVKPGESVWAIAEKYAGENKQVKELAVAIHEVNSLDSEGRVVPGQVIKVPVLAELHK